MLFGVNKEEVIAAYAARDGGDKDAFGNFLNRLMPQIIRACQQRLYKHNVKYGPLSAEDFTSIVFQKLLISQQPDLSLPNAFDRWLSIVIQHQVSRAIVANNRQKRGGGVLTLNNGGCSEIEDHRAPPEVMKELLEEIGALGEREGDLANLWVQGYNDVQAAEKLGITDRSVRRIKEIIRRHLKDPDSSKAGFKIG